MHGNRGRDFAAEAAALLEEAASVHEAAGRTALADRHRSAARSLRPAEPQPA